jgi:hypothetical protein
MRLILITNYKLLFFYKAYATPDCTNTYVTDGLLTYLGCKNDF